MFAADGGREAIHAGGLAVNGLNLTSPTEIRDAVPVAREAALSVKSHSESTSWKTGDFTSLPTAISQNWLYEQNREWHFTDGTLAPPVVEIRIQPFPPTQCRDALFTPQALEDNPNLLLRRELTAGLPTNLLNDLLCRLRLTHGVLLPSWPSLSYLTPLFGPH